jgi:type VI secretion system protein ImpG
MNREYYTRELIKLRRGTKSFSQDHPALAPQLANDATDPDVERLLEGFAYLTAQLQEKLDDEFPQIIHALTEVFFPRYLRPVPCSTMVQFFPAVKAGKQINMGKHAQIISQPINGKQYVFRTVAPLTVAPLILDKTAYIVAEKGGYKLQLDFTCLGLTVTHWQSDALLLYANGSFDEGSNLLFLLQQYCHKISVKTSDTNEFYLPEDSLYLLQFSPDQMIDRDLQIDVPSRKMLRDYLTFPQQYLLFQINNLTKWQTRGTTNNFSLTFYLNEIPHWFNRETTHIAINVIPATNIFYESAQPIVFDQKLSEYRITIDSRDVEQKFIYKVEDVSGSDNDNTVVQFIPFSHAIHNLTLLNSYQLHYYPSHLTKDVNWYISLARLAPNQDSNTVITLHQGLLCSNGSFAEKVTTGLLDVPFSIPGNMRVTNLHSASKYYPLQLDDAQLWNFLSLLSYNLFAAADLNLFREILRLEAKFLRGFDLKILEKKLTSITEFIINHSDRLYYDAVIVGYDVQFNCDLEGFSSRGDIFIFFSVIEYYFVNQLPFNTYLKQTVKINDTGEVIQWKARTPDKLLD